MKLKYAWSLKMCVNPKLAERMGKPLWDAMWKQVNLQLGYLYNYLDNATGPYLDDSVAAEIKANKIRC